MAHFALVALFFIPFLVFIAWLVIVATGVVKSEKRERDAPTTFHPNRAYLRWQSKDGWPRGPFLSYECALCGQSIPSKPSRMEECGCGNLFVGPQSVGAKDEKQVRLFEDHPDNNPPANYSFGAR